MNKILPKIPSKIRLDRLLSNLGYGSRKDIATLMKHGRISPSKPVSSLIDLAQGEHENLFIDGEKCDPIAPLTLILNKPQNYTCSHDEDGLLIYDLLPPRFSKREPKLSAAGRLDKDSTGLVLITDDGDLLHRIISPKKQITKKYKVVLRDDLQGTESAIFASGDLTFVNDTKPLKPALWTPHDAKSGIMELQEGRFHQIRRMFRSLGNEVVDLHRFQIGNLRLEDLPMSQYRVLTKTEIEAIF
jgi:16S rRNA pseudouridine516 synthase